MFGWDVLCIQEPPLDVENRRGLQSPQWTHIYPLRTADNREAPIRSYILIRSSIRSDTYSFLPIPSPDLSGIRLKLEDNELLLFNVYNPPSSNSSIHSLDLFLRNFPSSSQFFLIGDFNKHDPLWAGHEHPSRTQRASPEATELLELIATYELELVLPPGTVTFTSDAHSTGSTIDLVFASSNTAERLLTCKTAPGHGSDHRLVQVELDNKAMHRSTASRPQFREMDWNDFRTKLEKHLHEHPLPDMNGTAERIDEVTNQLTEAMKTVLEQVVPQRLYSIYVKKWWTKELTNKRKEYFRADRTARKRNATDQVKEHARKLRNEYLSAIRTQTRLH